MTVVDDGALVYYLHHSEEYVVAAAVVVVVADGIAFGVLMMSNDVIEPFSPSRSAVE